MKITEKTFVSLAYTLKVGDQIVDSTTKENPLEFVYGAGYLLPKFEEHIKDLGTGDKFKFTLTAADGYGEVITEAIVELPKDVFMVDGAIEDGLLVVGNQIPMSTADGQHLLGVIVELSDDKVKVDFNHPMAGNTLDFSGEIVNVREATDEDYMSGMGGGCDDCGEESEGCDCGCH